MMADAAGMLANMIRGMDTHELARRLAELEEVVAGSPASGRRSGRRARRAREGTAALLGAAAAAGVPGTAEGAAAQKVKDGTEVARFRAVLVTVLKDRSEPTAVRLLPG